MRNTINIKTFLETPMRVSLISYSHTNLLLTRFGVSYNLFFPIADYIEQKQSKVQFVVLNEISKSVQRPWQPDDIVDYVLQRIIQHSTI